MKGGKREGAGRPHRNTVRQNYMIEPQVVKRLHARVQRGKRSEFVTQAITFSLDALELTPEPETKPKTLVERFSTEPETKIEPIII